MSDRKVFPIKSETACLQKWSWSSIWLNAKSSSSCHRVKAFPLTLENFDNFHNLPDKIRQREMMLNGQWPGQGCEYCKVVEDSGGVSDRIITQQDTWMVPEELWDDPTATSVTPTLVEIFAENTCNLSCVYCSGSLSSKIEQENKKFGSFAFGGLSMPEIGGKNDQTEGYLEKAYSWLRNNVQTIKRLHVLGGETFLQRNLMNSVLNILNEYPNNNLQVNIISNLSVPEKLFDEYTDRFIALKNENKIFRFNLSASIDSWSDKPEYVRYGLDRTLFMRNFKKAALSDPINFQVDHTISVMSIRDMANIVQLVNEHGVHRYIRRYYALAGGQNGIFQPKIFGGKFWKDDFEKILDMLPKTTSEELDDYNQLAGLWATFKDLPPEPEKIKLLHVYLDEIDRRRDTNWRLAFPYLDIDVSKL